jgi:hypothetical protein
MVTGGLRGQIDGIWDSVWTCGIPNPLEAIEQITYLLFIRRLDDLHTVEELKSAGLKRLMARRISPEGTNRQGRPPDDLFWLQFRKVAAPDMTAPAPAPKDIIIDSAASSTCGLLVVAGKYVQRHHTEVLHDEPENISVTACSMAPILIPPCCTAAA